ncbi:hypothetical protein C483_10611 [Natrialba hulunbeirensis JCM 10989]|uniref:eCIS core domain-containing protein n=1 Tax=Natrialba hulunbeirensis JCM 10989 TaxID=1227493 RepID=L9ZXA6_9EURY|nr:hypothetical protein C483_10611 [Natrialba hulunbeirensis JCM 10989]
MIDVGGEDQPLGGTIQRALKGTGTSQDEVPNTVLNVLGDGGQSLDQPIQRALEERMDADFLNVRIHPGTRTVEVADVIAAAALGDATASTVIDEVVSLFDGQLQALVFEVHQERWIDDRRRARQSD